MPVKPKIFIPPHPYKSSRDVFWVLVHCLKALDEQKREKDRLELRQYVLNGQGKTYQDLVDKMKEYVDFEFVEKLN